MNDLRNRIELSSAKSLQKSVTGFRLASDPRILFLCFSLIFFSLMPGFTNAQTTGFTQLVDEQRANNITAGPQYIYTWSSRTIAIQPDGGYIVGWVDADGNDGNKLGIYARRFNADGTPAGDQFLVNTVTSGDQTDVTVATSPDGSFLVGWTSAGTSSTDVFGQLYNRDNTKKGNEFLLCTTISGTQKYPEVAFFPDGTFLSGFVDGATVAMQKYDANGRNIGLERHVSAPSGDAVIDGLFIRQDYKWSLFF